MLLGSYDSKRAKRLITMNRRKLRLITGFLTGHCSLNGHLTQIGAVDCNLCRYCRAGKEDPEHILTVCDAISLKRAMCLENLSPSVEEIPSTDPLKILRLLKEIGLEEVL